MARPSDWTPLGLSSDPVPGDLARISQEAAHLASVANTISGQVAALRKIGGDAALVGHYADTLRSTANDVAGDLDKVIGRYQKVSAALNQWIPDLEQAQAQSITALNQAEVPAKKLNTPVVLPSGSNLTAQQKQGIQDYHTSMNQAQGELDAAKALLNKATSFRDTQARHYADIINKACDDGMRDHHSWWSSFTSWVSGVVHHFATAIKDICTVLEVVATVLAIAAFIIAQFIPGLDVVVDAFVLAAFWMTAGAMLGRLLLAATGNGSWWDFGLDAFACLTFGIGRVVGTGIKATAEGAQLTSKGMMVTELMDPALGGAKATEFGRFAGFMGWDAATMAAKAEQFAPQLVAVAADGGKLSGALKVLANLGTLSSESEASVKLLGLGARFAGSVVDYSELTKLALGVSGVSAGVGGLTGIAGLADGGITLEQLPFGIPNVELHIPGLYNWYNSTFEVPTGG
jgi:hypothetical protein